MQTNGWVKLHRKLLETSFYKHSPTVHLFIHLLISANKQEQEFLFNKKIIKIEAGQLVTGRKILSEKTGISTQSIRTALVNLKVTNTITIKTTTKFSIITVLNWNEYQEVTNKLTNQQPTTNQQLTTNKNIENIEKDINNADTPSELETIIKEIDKSQHIKTEHQFLGLELHAQLNAPPDKKGEIIRIVRDYPRNKVDQARSFAVDYSGAAPKWKMFFWKLNILMKNK